MTDHANEKHGEFHLRALLFFLGMRLSAMEAGYLDATPIKPGSLVDFVLLGESLERAIDLAEHFWIANHHEPRNISRYKAAVHALFLSQFPPSLQFEEVPAGRRAGTRPCAEKPGARVDEKISLLLKKVSL